MIIINVSFSFINFLVRAVLLAQLENSVLTLQNPEHHVHLLLTALENVLNALLALEAINALIQSYHQLLVLQALIVIVLLQHAYLVMLGTSAKKAACPLILQLAFAHLGTTVMT